VERIFGGVEQNAPGAWHVEATQARDSAALNRLQKAVTPSGLPGSPPVWKPVAARHQALR
jgi:hypothetical protein